LVSLFGSLLDSLFILVFGYDFGFKLAVAVLGNEDEAVVVLGNEDEGATFLGCR
jgi:hypothetical protein